MPPAWMRWTLHVADEEGMGCQVRLRVVSAILCMGFWVVELLIWSRMLTGSVNGGYVELDIFVNVSMTSHWFISKISSRIARTCVACTRYDLNLVVCWIWSGDRRWTLAVGKECF